MKNVTVTMEEAVAEKARMEAARRNTRVSRLVGDMLAEKMKRDRTHEGAMRAALKFAAVPFEGRFLKRGEVDAERLDRFR